MTFKLQYNITSVQGTKSVHYSSRGFQRTHERQKIYQIKQYGRKSQYTIHTLRI